LDEKNLQSADLVAIKEREVQEKEKVINKLSSYIESSKS